MNKFLIIVFCFAVCSCGKTDRLENTKEIKEQVENQKIHHITQIQILETATKWGKNSILILQKSLSNTLTEKLKKDDIVLAAGFCKVSALSPTDSIQKSYHADIKRFRIKGQALDSLNEMQKQILDAYQYNLENKLVLEENVQKVGEKQLLFTAPITIKEQMCLRCHGKLGTDISESDFKIIQKKYPKVNDLSGFTLNQTIGIWSVLLEKKQVVKNSWKK